MNWSLLNFYLAFAICFIISKECLQPVMGENTRQIFVPAFQYEETHAFNSDDELLARVKREKKSIEQTTNLTNTRNSSEKSVLQQTSSTSLTNTPTTKKDKPGTDNSIPKNSESLLEKSTSQQETDVSVKKTPRRKKKCQCEKCLNKNKPNTDSAIVDELVNSTQVVEKKARPQPSNGQSITTTKRRRPPKASVQMSSDRKAAIPDEASEVPPASKASPVNVEPHKSSPANEDPIKKIIETKALNGSEVQPPTKDSPTKAEPQPTKRLSGKKVPTKAVHERKVLPEPKKKSEVQRPPRDRPPRVAIKPKKSSADNVDTPRNVKERKDSVPNNESEDRPPAKGPKDIPAEIESQLKKSLSDEKIPTKEVHEGKAPNIKSKVQKSTMSSARVESQKERRKKSSPDNENPTKKSRENKALNQKPEEPPSSEAGPVNIDSKSNESFSGDEDLTKKPNERKDPPDKSPLKSILKPSGTFEVALEGARKQQVVKKAEIEPEKIAVKRSKRKDGKVAVRATKAHHSSSREKKLPNESENSKNEEIDCNSNDKGEREPPEKSESPDLEDREIDPDTNIERIGPLTRKSVTFGDNQTQIIPNANKGRKPRRRNSASAHPTIGCIVM